MAQIIVKESQLKLIQERITFEGNLEMAKNNWKTLSENEKKLVISLIEINSPKDAKLLQEKWYNTLMDVLGLVDPTPIVDTINAVSYFSQGETLFGVLTLISAIPYAGDIVAKPVIGALKVGNVATKELKVALDLVKVGNATKDATKTAEGVAKLTSLAKDPGIVGKFLRSAESWSPKVISWIDKVPAGPFKGMKNTIRDYFVLLGRAGAKSKNVQSMVKIALAAPTEANLLRNIPKIQTYLKDTKIFSPSALTKPGFFSQVFFGGIPRLFRSPEGRGIKILMGKTKFWLGFLDYVGIGNFIGPEELEKKMGGADKMADRMEEYQKTSQAREYYNQDFKDTESGQQQSQQSANTSSATKSSDDPIQSLLHKMFTGTAKNAAALF